MMAKGRGLQAFQNLQTRKSEEKKNFQRIFFGMFLSMLTVILIASGVAYKAVKDVLVEQNSQRIMETFSRVQEDFEEINASANRIAVQVMLDEACEPYLTAASEDSIDEMDIRKAILRLSRYQGINSMVESIYIYNKKLENFLCSIMSECFDGFSDKNILEILEQPEKYETNSLILREKTVKYGNGVERTKTVYSYILYSSRRGDLGNAVIINLDLEEMIGGFWNWIR